MRILIADDESAARAKIRRFLEAWPEHDLAGEAANGTETVAQILAERPDLVFLDINMPGFDGFEVLDQIPADRIPRIIFATAYDDRAVRAFEVDAVDYLLKPFDRNRFNQALNRAVNRMTQEEDPGGGKQFASVIERLGAGSGFPSRLVVQNGKRLEVVVVANIEWIESAGNYVILHKASGEHLMRTTLAALEEKLDPRIFCRVHRQSIVNTHRISGLQPWTKGDMVIQLQGGAKVKLSRRYREELFMRLEA